MRYSSQQLEHFHNAVHAGKLDENDPNVIVVEEGGQNSPNAIRLYLYVENNIITRSRFLSYGSLPVTACCEYVCRYLEGKTLDEARQLNVDRIMKDLAMPRVEIHIATLAERLVKKSMQ